MRVVDADHISDADFDRFQKLILFRTGIHLTTAKKTMLCGRLGKRLRHLGLRGYREYYDLVTSGLDGDELETCINLMTTNETYFFREPKHFDYLREHILPVFRSKPLRIWSAACSSGEEPYTLGLVLAEKLGINADWEILGSDISTNVLHKAVAAVYPMERGEKIPRPLLQQYCLKGTGSMAGSFKVDDAVRRHTRFAQVNLNETLPEVGNFDVIFLRNVMIYFQMDVKTAVIERLIEHLRPGGWLFIGHSETLYGVTNRVRQIVPTIYQKPA